MTFSISEQLLKSLDKIDRPGTYCTSGELPSLVPGLEVSGVGTIALPLDKRQAAALKKQARQAPYGKGTETVVDTKVRRVWEIDAESITFANPAWAGVVQEAVAAIEAELGLGKQALQAHLYKLLLYEAGGFFLPHRDGEKLDRMVATLVIALPSPHEGGELIVRHEGQSETIDFGSKSRFQTQFAAFYADCEHEVRPVTEGFRLALTYNLTLKKGKGYMAAPTSSGHIAAMADLLRKWVTDEWTGSGRNDNATPPKLAVLLDHKYSEAGLTRDTLKGIDRAQADVLFAAAREAGCDGSLALMTYWESGLGEPAGGYDYGRRGRHRYDDDDTDDDGDYEMQEVYDHSLKAEHFSDSDGLPLAFGRIPFDEEELVSELPLNEREPDEQDFEGYTGNAGMTLERWYRRAAVVIWPEAARFDVLCGAGVEASVGGLAQMVRKWKRADADERDGLRASCLEFAERIIARWPERSTYGYRSANASAWDDYDEDFEVDGLDSDNAEIFQDAPPSSWDQTVRNDSPKKSPGQSLLSLLNTLGDASLVSAWIRGVLARDSSVTPGAELGRCCNSHGWLTFQVEFQSLFEGTNHETLERHAALLNDFSLREDRNADRIALCAGLARQLLVFVEAWNPRGLQSDWRARRINALRLLSAMTQSFLALDEPELVARLAKYVLDRSADFDLTTTRVPMWLALEEWLKANVRKPVAPLRHWLSATAETLEARAAQPPQEPVDFRRESATGCKCADCKVLTRFLADPKEAKIRLPLAEARRGHLVGVIKDRALDATHATERVGRPYTLVLTKNKNSYKRALQAYHVDLDQLAKVKLILAWHEGLRSENAVDKKAKVKAKPRSAAKPKVKKG